MYGGLEPHPIPSVAPGAGAKQNQPFYAGESTLNGVLVVHKL